MHALGLEFGSAAQLSKRPGSVWNCLWGNALKRSPGFICKSRVSYPGPGFLSSATWPSLPKKHYNGLNQTCLCILVDSDAAPNVEAALSMSPTQAAQQLETRKPTIGQRKPMGAKKSGVRTLY